MVAAVEGLGSTQTAAVTDNRSRPPYFYPTRLVFWILPRSPDLPELGP